MRPFRPSPLPRLYRYTFDPGDKKTARLVDAWKADDVPKQVLAAHHPYRIDILEPSTVIADLNNDGWLFCCDLHGAAMAKRGFEVVMIELGQATARGSLTALDCLYVDTLLAVVGQKRCY